MCLRTALVTGGEFFITVVQNNINSWWTPIRKHLSHWNCLLNLSQGNDIFQVEFTKNACMGKLNCINEDSHCFVMAISIALLGTRIFSSFYALTLKLMLSKTISIIVVPDLSKLISKLKEKILEIQITHISGGEIPTLISPMSERLVGEKTGMPGWMVLAKVWPKESHLLNTQGFLCALWKKASFLMIFKWNELLLGELFYL